MNHADFFHDILDYFLSRKRMFFLLLGSCGALLAALLVSALWISLDVRLSLPPAARMAGDVVVLGGALAVFLRAAVLPLWRLRAPQAIREIEDHYAGLGQSLRTATQLADALPPEVSPRLAEAMLEDAETRAKMVQPDEMIPWRRLFAWLGATNAAIALFVGGLAFWPDGRTGLARLVRPKADISFTRIRLAADPDVVRANQPVEFSARLSGRHASPVLLHVCEDGGQWATRELMLDEATGILRATWDSHEASCQYYATAGDGRTAPARLRVVVPPRIGAVTSEVQPPEYTGLPARVVSGGDITAVEGSRVRLRFVLNHPLVAGEIRAGTQQRFPVRIDGASVVAELPVPVGELIYHLEGHDSENVTLDPVEYSLRGQPDRPPALEIVSPGANVEVTSITEVPLRLRARDDFGVKEVGLVFVVRDASKVLNLVRVDARNQKEVLSDGLLPLEDYDVYFRDNLELYAYGRDHKPDRARPAVSEMHYIDIRPFMKQYQQMFGGGPGGRMITLEKLIHWQRQNLSKTHVYRENGPAEARLVVALATSEYKLAGETEEFEGMVQDWPIPPEVLADILQCLQEAHNGMLAAVDSLEGRQLEPAQDYQQAALSSLILARQLMVNLRIHPLFGRNASDWMDRTDEQMLPKLEAPEDVTPCQAPGEIAEALAELAQQEQGLADEVVGSPRIHNTTPNAQAQPGQMAQAQQGQQGQQGQGPGEGQGQGQSGSGRGSGQGSGNPIEQQREMIGEAEDLQQHLKENSEATQLAQQRMQQALEAMRAALGSLMSPGHPNADRQALQEAQVDLEQLAEHLRGLALLNLATRMELASEMAGSMQRRVAETPRAASQEAAARPGDATGGAEAPDAATRLADVQQDARTLSDWMTALQHMAAAKDEELAARVGEISERGGVAHLPDDLVRIAALAGSRETQREAQLRAETAERLAALVSSLDLERRRMLQGLLERLVAAESEASSLRDSLPNRQANAGGGEPGQEQPSGQQPGQDAQNARPPGQEAGNGQGGDRQQPGTGGDTDGPGGARERLNRLADELADLGDPQLIEFSGQLRRTANEARGGPGAPGQAFASFDVDSSLGPIIQHLQYLIKEVMRAEATRDSNQTVPDVYLRLVEKYYKTLSDDLR